MDRSPRVTTSSSSSATGDRLPGSDAAQSIVAPSPTQSMQVPHKTYFRTPSGISLADEVSSFCDRSPALTDEDSLILSLLHELTDTQDRRLSFSGTQPMLIRQPSPQSHHAQPFLSLPAYLEGNKRQRLEGTGPGELFPLHHHPALDYSLAPYFLPQAVRMVHNPPHPTKTPSAFDEENGRSGAHHPGMAVAVENPWGSAAAASMDLHQTLLDLGLLMGVDTSSSPGLGSHGSRLSGAVTQTQSPLGAFLSPDLFGARPVHLDLAGISASLPQSLSAAALLGPQDGLHGMAADDLIFGTTEDEAGAGEEPGVKRRSHRDAVRRTREEIKRAVDDMRALLEELLPNPIESDSNESAGGRADRKASTVVVVQTAQSVVRSLAEEIRAEEDTCAALAEQNEALTQAWHTLKGTNQKADSSVNPKATRDGGQ